MELQGNKIAIISPSNNTYSETFIQVQKRGLSGQVFYYYGGVLPQYLENYGLLLSKRSNLVYKLKKKIGLTDFDAHELAFIKSIKKHKIQVVLAQYGTTAHRIVKICSYLEVPLVTHFHGFDASVKEVVKRCNNYKKVFAYSSKVIAVSRTMERMLIDIGCPKEKIVYNPCAPQTEFMEIIPEFLKKQFISIGRFTNKKAPYYTIFAFKKVLEKYPDAHLFMAGDGELLNTCKNIIKLYNMQSQVTFLGVITSVKFRSLLKESLAFVQHSVTAVNGDMEGTPVAILEASIAGLPVISTFHAGIPDVVVHGKTGLLCEEHDVETMSKHMLQVLDDVSFAKQLGQAGKKYIKQNFSMTHHIDKLQKILTAVSKKA
jgi:glycosyltransferase involved in cell wall biosynthesis